MHVSYENMDYVVLLSALSVDILLFFSIRLLVLCVEGFHVQSVLGVDLHDIQ